MGSRRARRSSAWHGATAMLVVAALGALGAATAAAPVASAAVRATAAGTPVPGSSCPMFPPDNVWNTDISTLPIHPRSAAWMASMNSAGRNLHPDFGPSFGAQPVPYGIPFTVVDASHPKVAVTFDYAAESDPGPYPFGADTPIEGGPNAGGDRHAIMVDRSTCTLYELYDAQYNPSGSTAGSGAIWSLSSDALRPATWTSADAAGLPILPGLLRPDEVRAGVVNHAIRFTASRTDQSLLWPARHQAGSAADPNLPPMGARFRLRATFDISHFRPDTQVILRAMQHYGLILADNGSDWYFQGSADDSWDNGLLDELKTIPASAFDVVDESSLMIDPNSAQARNPSVPVVPVIPGGGYRLVASDGGIFSFGDAVFFGSTGALHLAAPIVGMAATPSGRGYWLVASDGGIFNFGEAPFLGSAAAAGVAAPVVGMAATHSGGGYWVAAANGAVYAFGDAPFLGSAAVLNHRVVALIATAGGDGYRLVSDDGGVFVFGDASFLGSAGAVALAQPVVGGA